MIAEEGWSCMAREKHLKNWSRAKKIAFIEKRDRDWKGHALSNAM
jgi:predicted GIY-YIG superfamily endonuclease